MLLGQKGGRTENRHLTPRHGGDKGGAKCDFSFAKAHITADQPVHRLPGSHVVDHRIYGRGLIGGFIKSEAFAKGLIVCRIDLEADAFTRAANGIQI